MVYTERPSQIAVLGKSRAKKFGGRVWLHMKGRDSYGDSLTDAWGNMNKSGLLLAPLVLDSELRDWKTFLGLKASTAVRHSQDGKFHVDWHRNGKDDAKEFHTRAGAVNFAAGLPEK
jgi:hypothetical protein